MSNKHVPDTPAFVNMPDGSTQGVDLRELGPLARQKAIEAIETGNYVVLTEDNAATMGITLEANLELANKAALIEMVALDTAPDSLYTETIAVLSSHGAGEVLAELSGKQITFLVCYLLTGNIRQSAKKAGVCRKSPYNWMNTARFHEALTTMRSLLNSDALSTLAKKYMSGIVIPDIALDIAVDASSNAAHTSNAIG